MSTSLGRIAVLFYAFMPLFAFAGDQFTAPTAQELKMTVEPAAPDASAIYLFRDERADDKLHIHTVYVRLKILTAKGKDYADVVIPYEGNHFLVRDIQGRTIHSDGTIVPFTGKPFDQVVVKSSSFKYKTKAFSMPDVQVGSILEYRYVLGYDDDLVLSPQWFLSQDAYVRKAHFQFLPTEHAVIDGHGNFVQSQLAYSSNVAPPAKVEYQQLGNLYLLDAEKISPLPNEEYMPPMQSTTQRVLFYYTAIRTSAEYWKNEGKYWSKSTDRFINSGHLGDAVAQTVAASDTPRQKLEKIYDAIMAMENTSFTRGHSEAENNANGLKVKTAADIWAQKRGSSDELAMLFIGMARAAGLPAYAAVVANRDQTIFNNNYLAMSQLDDVIAIVSLDGKEEMFDPGERFCQFGELHWKHTYTQGLRQTQQGSDLFTSSSIGYKSTQIGRFADLQMEPDGKVSGTVRITMTGSEALYWRQQALLSDEAETKRLFEERLQSEVPAGMEVKADHFLGLTDSTHVLLLVAKVDGSMATATGKRLFMPSTFFKANAKPLFVHDKREMPVDLRYPFQEHDQVTLHLTPSIVVEALPKDTQIPLPKNAIYQTSTKQSPGKIETNRTFILANSIYPTAEYGSLKDFYQKVSTRDQEQAVLQAAPASSGGGAQ